MRYLEQFLDMFVSISFRTGCGKFANLSTDNLKSLFKFSPNLNDRFDFTSIKDFSVEKRWNEPIFQYNPKYFFIKKYSRNFLTNISMLTRRFHLARQ